MNDPRAAQPQDATGANDGAAPSLLPEGGRWESARREIAAPLPGSGEAGDDGMATLWTAALCLCLRRYGAPATAGLTVLTFDRGGKITTRHRIDLKGADTIRAGEWLDTVRSFPRDDPALDVGEQVAPEPGPFDGWRVALILRSDRSPPDHDILASCDRWFAVQSSSGSAGLSAGRGPARTTDDWPLAQMLAHWEQLAKGLAETPEEPVGRLPANDPTKADSLIASDNKPGEAIADLRFSFELFDDQVVRTPLAPAVTNQGETVSYLELWERSNRLAHFLQSLGVGPETIVGVFLERSTDLVVAVIGLQKAGAAYLPIDPAYPRGRLDYLISDSRVTLILTNALQAKRLPPGGYRAVLLDRESDAIAAMDAGKPVHGLKPGNMAFVFYTSGSTGQPKGVAMEHTVRAPFDRSKREPDNLAEGEKVLLKSPVGFTLILREIFWPLHWGGHLVVLPDGLDRDSAYLVQVLRDENVVGANFVPSMLSLLVDEPHFDQCTSLRLIYTVGESLAVEVQKRLLARLPGVRLFVFYGCTEAPAATFRECKIDEPYGNRVVIGKPMANKKVYLLDRNLMPVPSGVAGEIHTGGQISRGYLHRPDLTADRFIPDPFSNRPGARFYRTGDLARQLPDGSLEFLGRADFQVQVRGVRVELGEIEAVIAAHPTVKEALVIADPRHPEQTRLIAYYTDREGTRTPVAELRGLLRGQLPEYMMPSSFTRLAAFPLNANGKVDRRNLPEPMQEAVRSDQAVVAPRTAAEVRLLGLWARILGVDRLGVTDRFFDLGGDSMLAAKALAQIRREFGVTLSLPDFYREPTIEAVARLLAGESVGTGLRLFLPISTQGNRRPVFMANTYPALARYIGPDQPFYGMKNHWLDARLDYEQDVPAIARDFLREMREIQPTGPYAIFGFSMGGLFALELARQLEDAGQKLDVLLLLDPTMPDDPAEPDETTSEPEAPAPPGDAGPTGWLNRHRSKLRGLSFAQMVAYVWRRRGAFVRPFDKFRAKQLLHLGRAFNATGRDIPFGLRKRVAAHYYSRIRRAYQPQPLRSRAKVYLVDRHVPAKLALLNRLFPAGVDVRILATKSHLDTMIEPHVSRWMDDLKTSLGDPPSPPPDSPAPREKIAPDAPTIDPNESEDLRTFRVAHNDQGQFSAWPITWHLPEGWTATDFQGGRKSCLAHIGLIWTDDRPVSLR